MRSWDWFGSPSGGMRGSRGKCCNGWRYSVRGRCRLRRRDGRNWSLNRLGLDDGRWLWLRRACRLRLQQRGQLVSQEAHIELKIPEILAQPFDRVLAASPDRKYGNDENDNEKEFHTMACAGLYAQSAKAFVMVEILCWQSHEHDQAGRTRTTDSVAVPGFHFAPSGAIFKSSLREEGSRLSVAPPARLKLERGRFHLVHALSARALLMQKNRRPGRGLGCGYRHMLRC